MAHLLHLNGQPGIGKSTLARRFAAARPGTLICDIDVLRTMITGWQHDVATASRMARAAGLAMITRYLSDGGDVVVPQLVARPDRLRQFADAARSAGARYQHVLLHGDPGPGTADGSTPTTTARALERCTQDELDAYRGGLEEVLRAFPHTTTVVSTDEVQTYARLLESVAPGAVNRGSRPHD